MKYKADANELLRKRESYFVSTITVCCVFYAILIVMASLFFIRCFKAWRLGLVWSRRRYVISLNSAFLLFFQIANLTFMILGVAYALSGTCKWQSRFMVSMGYAQWTSCNCSLIILVALAHNGSVWKGETKLARAKSASNFFSGRSKTGAMDNAAVDAAEKGMSVEESADADKDENKTDSPFDKSLSAVDENEIEEPSRHGKDAASRCTSFPIQDGDGFAGKSNSSIVDTAAAPPEGDAETHDIFYEAEEYSEHRPYDAATPKLRAPKSLLPNE